MRSPVARVVKNSVRAGQDMVSQIVVSVATAVCVALITNAYFEQKTTAPEPAVTEATDQAADTVAKTPIRIITENANNSAGGLPLRPLQPAAASLVRNAAEALPVVAEPIEETAGSSLPALATQTIADLPVRDVTSSPDAEIFPGVPAGRPLAEALQMPLPAAEQRAERRRFLGLPLPYFVPTASDLVQSASAAGGRIAEIVDRRLGE